MRYLLFIFILIYSGNVFAAEYYVEAKASSALNLTDEGATAWGNATSASTPVSFETALNRASAGDTVYLRGGQYDADYSWNGEATGSFNVENSGSSGSPIIFKNYPDETPLLNCTNVTNDYCIILSSGAGNEYITFDGLSMTSELGTKAVQLSLHGDVTEGNPKMQGIVAANLHIYGGGQTGTVSNNRDGIRLEDLDGVWVHNCLIHGISHVSGDDNWSGIKLYHVENGLIENNEIYDCDQGIYDKSYMDGTVIRNNYIHDINYQCGIKSAQFISQTYSSNNNEIYNNLIVNVPYGGILFYSDDGVTVSGNKIYNNTIYQAKTPISISIGTGWQVYNNIMDVQNISGWEHLLVDGGSFTPSKFDHNLWSDTIGSFMARAVNGTDYTSLASFKLSGWCTDVGLGSIYDTPIFVNTSGNMDEVDDFALTAASPGYQVGTDSEDMGADVSLVGSDIEVPAGDTTDPTVTITSPTSNATYATSSSTINIGGTAYDETALSSVSWACPTCTPTSDTATGTTTWSETGIGLSTGENVITVTATDSSSNTGQDVLTVTYTPSGDSTPPTVTAFDIPVTGSSLTVSINTFTATDDTAVTDYLLTESASTPSTSDPDWQSSAQTSYTFSSYGSKTLYAWAIDAAENISSSLNDSITLTNPAVRKVGAVSIGGTIQ